MKLILLLLILTSPATSANIINDICIKNGKLIKTQFSAKLLSKLNFKNDLSKPIESLFESLGKCSKVNINNGEMIFEFKNHFLNGSYFLKDNQFVSIWFDSPRMKNKNIDQLLKDLNRDGNVTSYYFVDNMKIYKKDENNSLFIASSIKLNILEEYEKCISRKKCSKEDTLILKEDIKTSPSGILHLWPSGEKLLVSTAINLMISQSDNTATDLIIHYLAEKKMKRFITMQSKFISLYAPESVSFGPDDFKKVNLSSYPKSGGSISTTKNLCKTILNLKESKSLSINQDGLSGLFKKLLYKGGSRFGVFQKTYAWQTENNIWKCLSVTINNPNGIKQSEISKTIRSIIY